jgi:predicted DNA-binding transcriptional regulator AlpA
MKIIEYEDNKMEKIIATAFISIKGLCERYGIKRTAFYNWRKKKQFPSPVTPPNCNPRWRVSDVEQWENNNFKAAA